MDVLFVQLLCWTLLPLGQSNWYFNSYLVQRLGHLTTQNKCTPLHMNVQARSLFEHALTPKNIYLLSISLDQFHVLPQRYKALKLLFVMK